MDLKILVLDDDPVSLGPIFNNLNNCFGASDIDIDGGIEEHDFTIPSYGLPDGISVKLIIFQELNIEKAKKYIDETAHEFDLVLIDSNWGTSDNYIGQRCLLPYAYERLKGPYGVPDLPCFAVFTQHFSSKEYVWSFFENRNKLRGPRKMVTALNKDIGPIAANALAELLYQACFIKSLAMEKAITKAGATDVVELPAGYQAKYLIGKSPEICRIQARLHKIAQFWKLPTSNAHVVFEGKPGTGKGTAAKELAFLSERKNISKISCNKFFAKDSFASELFGTKRGEYTDAKDRESAIKKAENGVVIFDELNSLDLDSQKILLNLFNDDLPDQKRNQIALPVAGGDHQFADNVALIFITNEPLKELLTQNKILKDLYDRLTGGGVNGNIITMPPIKGRESDVLLIIHNIMKQEFELDVTRSYSFKFSHKAENFILQHPWEESVRSIKMIASNMANAIMLEAQNLSPNSSVEIIIDENKLREICPLFFEAAKNNTYTSAGLRSSSAVNYNFPDWLPCPLHGPYSEIENKWAIYKEYANDILTYLLDHDTEDTNIFTIDKSYTKPGNKGASRRLGNSRSGDGAKFWALFLHVQLGSEFNAEAEKVLKVVRNKAVIDELAKLS